MPHFLPRGKGWICQICKRRVPPNLAQTRQSSLLTLDHSHLPHTTDQGAVQPPLGSDHQRRSRSHALAPHAENHLLQPRSHPDWIGLMSTAATDVTQLEPPNQSSTTARPDYLLLFLVAPLCGHSIRRNLPGCPPTAPRVSRIRISMSAGSR
jgi:hypothetical protein